MPRASPSGFSPKLASVLTALVTGSSGLIGSEVVEFFDHRGWRVEGIDNNMRREFFGPAGDTARNLEAVQKATRRFTHHDVDVRDREAVARLVRGSKPDLLVHCAAQPSHDLAAKRPVEDFEVNAVGTLNVLEAARAEAPDSPFVFLSTNKVYGDAPNELPLTELETRWDYADEGEGVDESCRVDESLHSLFGASKLAADVLVQEYGRYYGMPTVCLRAGCVTGARHAAVELHGFLAYLARALAEDRLYRIYGYKGKQVRDNIHSADVCAAIMAFVERPRPAGVYNLGGGRANSISILEAIARFEELTGKRLEHDYVDEPRRGDHVCYITNLARFRGDYPEWDVRVSLDAILAELARASRSA
jgi:CDP-paratose 2-epimerase